VFDLPRGVRMAAEAFVAGDLSAVRQCLGPNRAPALLRSAAIGPQGRFDLLPLIDTAPLIVPYPNHPLHAQRLATLQSQLQRLSVGKASGVASDVFASGWLIYLAYEFGSVFEPGVVCLSPEFDEPLAVLWRVPAALIHDRLTQTQYLAGEQRADWRARLARTAIKLANGAVVSAAMPAVQLSEDDPQRFLDGVARIHDYLLAGDVFQVNLSRAWRGVAAQAIDLDSLFTRLSKANPAPFAGVLSLGGWGIASSSPERLVSVRGDLVETRPIAGTRRRDANPHADAKLLAELQRDPKERAEHIMLIDLERNDLGRLCKPGSIEVDELGGIESYAHVHHLVSNVRGRLREDMDVWSLLRALFPGGTITGCPKVRCMQIIAELEQVGRGAYTGALGYIGDDGVLDINILIRTLSVQGNCLSFRAGAGIVADSVAKLELNETRAKALGLLRALGLP